MNDLRSPHGEMHFPTREIKWAFLAHLGFLFLFVLLEFLSTYFSSTTPTEDLTLKQAFPTLKVDLVDLPDILKKDLPEVLETPSTPPEAKQKNSAAPVKEKISKPLPVDRSQQAPQFAYKKKNNPTSAKAALQRLKALDKIQNQLVEEEPVVIKGNKVSAGASLSGEAREGEETYYEKVREHLLLSWALPPWLSRKKESTRVRVFVDLRGKILKKEFLPSSASTAFMRAIDQTILESDPLPAPPLNLRSTLRDQGIVIGFPL